MSDWTAQMWNGLVLTFDWRLQNGMGDVYMRVCDIMKRETVSETKNISEWKDQSHQDFNFEKEKGGQWETAQR